MTPLAPAPRRRLDGVLRCILACLVAGALLMPLTAGAKQVRWAVGQTVLAQWPHDKCWYQATIAGANPAANQYDVHYSDGDRARLGAAEITAENVGQGTRVWGNWRGGGTYYPGTIGRRDGDAIFIAYDDGDTETTTMAHICVRTHDLNR